MDGAREDGVNPVAAGVTSNFQVLMRSFFVIRNLLAAGLAVVAVAGSGGALRSAGAAVPKPVTLSIKSIVPRPRSLAPQTVEVDLGCNASELIEGRLEIKWYVGQRLVHDYVSPDLAITAGGQRFRLELPPILIRNEKTPVTAYARFLTARGAIDLGDFNMIITARSKRAFVLAVVQPQELLVPRSKKGLADSLGLEQFNPYRAMQFKTEPDGQFDMLTYPARLTPEEMPSTAAGYASYDMLLLEGEGFATLKPRQLVAIGDWVAAGGSVVVGPYEKMTIDHVNFLNRIAGPLAQYTLDDAGKLVAADESQGTQLVTSSPGLGRALVLRKRLPEEFNFESYEWKRTLTYLWKVREQQAGPILKNGVWDFTAPQPQFPGATVRPYAPASNDSLPAEIRQLLLPERIEGVPLATVIVILSLYLLAIAPGDYFLLGRLNCRKYTWGLFVLISAAFTWCTVLVAQNYMGHTDYRTALVLADLDDTANGSKARLARVTRFEMLFTATQRVIEMPQRDALYVDISDRAGQPQEQAWNRRTFAFAENEELDDTEAVSADLPVYTGIMPTTYKIVQQMRQWSPRVTRTTSLGDDQELLGATGIDWGALPSEAWHLPSSRQELRDAILAKEPDAEILLFHGKTIYDLAVSTNPLSAESWALKSRVASMARSASVRQPAGFFAVVSKISPTGGEYLEDLNLLDDSDPAEWLLVVIVRRDNNWLVFRKLSRGSSR